MNSKANNFPLRGLIWVTGLSGAGKTTFALSLQEKIENELMQRPILLDGDALREALKTESAHNPDQRKKMALFYHSLSTLISQQGQCVICATISMFEEVRILNRTKNDFYCEIFLDVEDTLRNQRKNNGSLRKEDITSNNTSFSLPQKPDFIFKNMLEDEIDYSCNSVIEFLKENWVEKQS